MSENDLDTLTESHSLFQMNKRKIISELEHTYVNFWMYINTGALIFNYSPTFELMEANLIGGLFSAIRSFSQEVIKNQIEYISLAGKNFIFYSEPNSNEDLFIVGCFDKKIDSKFAERRLKSIYKLFSNKYGDIIKKGKIHKTNTKYFKNFTRSILINHLYRFDEW